MREQDDAEVGTFRYSAGIGVASAVGAVAAADGVNAVTAIKNTANIAIRRDADLRKLPATPMRQDSRADAQLRYKSWKK